MKRIVLIVVLALAAAASLAAGVRNAVLWSQDFQYDAAKALVCGYDPYDLSLAPESGYDEIGQLRDFYEYFENMGTPQRMEANQFPSLLYILAPYTFLPWKTAKTAWLLTNLLCSAVIARLLRHTFLKDTQFHLYAAFMLLMIAGTPWRNQLGVGQHTLFAFMFFLAAAALEEKGYWIPASLALSLSYLKYTVTAPLALYFLYKRKWKTFLCSLIPHLIGTAAAAAVLKEPLPDMILKPLKVASALSGEGSIDIGVWLRNPGLTAAFTGLLFAVLLFAVLKLEPGRDRTVLALLILCSLIMTYHRSYDFFVIIAAAGLFQEENLFPEGERGRKLWMLSAVWYVILLCWFFFGMRFLRESTPSLIFGAVLYYGFTFLILTELAVSLKKG